MSPNALASWYEAAAGPPREDVVAAFRSTRCKCIHAIRVASTRRPTADDITRFKTAQQFGNPGLGRGERAAGAQVPLHAVTHVVILNRMVQYSQTHFDASFGALSDATRRGVLEQLGRADASITALAERFHMTLTGMKKHVGVLEQAGLVTTEKVGRVRTCRLGACRLEEETAWIERHRHLWASRFDELDNVVEELKRKEKTDGRKKRK